MKVRRPKVGDEVQYSGQLHKVVEVLPGEKAWIQAKPGGACILVSWGELGNPRPPKRRSWLETPPPIGVLGSNQNKRRWERPQRKRDNNAYGH